ncbi:MAG: hypothetical protein H7210_05120 [Pyrinomonadaceae bacterium]|nr:hypothetical protein [Phycisphaerales bacterium]
MNWEQILWDLLCDLYRKMGGDCADLPPRPPNPTPVPDSLPEVINDVEDLYNRVGLPIFTTPEELQKFLNLLTTIELHLDAPGNSLPPASDTQLRNLIAAMRGAAP